VIPALRLLHLGLLVADQQRSQQFYATYFDFDADSGQRYPDGTVIIRNADGFDLALHEGAGPGSLPEFVHFGFRCASPGQVREMFDRLVAGGVPIRERDEEPELVSFKCLDPDGYPVEVYWEP
jgi:catechol 2,3-dioxygenase-like lactoylglutathione lyase family enzyme